MTEPKCEACGDIGGDKYTHVHTTNGGLELCKQCLDDINRKNPELLALKKDFDRVSRENSQLRRSWGITDTEIIAFGGSGFLVIDRPGGDRNRISMACPKEFDRLQAENDRMKQLIESYGNNPAGFDWGVLAKIDELERELEKARSEASYECAASWRDRYTRLKARVIDSLEEPK